MTVVFWFPCQKTGEQTQGSTFLKGMFRVIQKNKFLLSLTAVCGVTAFAFSLSTASCQRHAYETQSETKVQTRDAHGFTVSIGRNGKNKVMTLDERVERILNNDAAYGEKAGGSVVVPQTWSRMDESIIGTPLASQDQCVKYLLRRNPRPNIEVSAKQLVAYYYEEGEREGIRPDVAFAQALKETGFFAYGGTVTPDQNNFCGLGTTSSLVKGAYFPSAEMGVRAHIQHLLAYASTRLPTTPIVDPRYKLVRDYYGAGTLNRYSDLNGRWAVPGVGYGQSVMSMFRAILRE